MPTKHIDESVNRKNGISVKNIDTSGYIIVHHTQAGLHPNTQYLSAQQYAYQLFLAASFFITIASKWHAG